MSGFPLLFISVGIGQFLLVLMPGIVRALIQLSPMGVSPYELLPLPLLLIFGGALSFCFLHAGRVLQREAYKAHLARTESLWSFLANGDFAEKWKHFRHRRFLLQVEAPVLLLRFFLICFFMSIEDWRIGLSGLLTALGAVIVLRRIFGKPRGAELQDDLVELYRHIFFQAAPAAVALLLLLLSFKSAASVATLFLFFGLLYEIGFHAEVWARSWFSGALTRNEARSLRTLERALSVTARMPAGEVALALELPRSTAPLRTQSPLLTLIPPQSPPPASAHFLWKGSRIEVSC